uniref:Sugar ABC transporter permease n=1 Tax=uncultured bacterium Contig33 TaxID=1393553 RepID=W0FJE8_9BACT|nr:sugar ABC transporter permease [uncultured bacterium Contig33]
MSKDNTVFIGKTKSFWDRNRRSNGYLLKRRVGEIAVSVFRALLMFGLCFMIIQPMLTRFGTSLMKEKDLYDSTIILLPRHVTLDNYRIVAELTDFPNSMVNTLWVSIVVSICQVVACTIVGYGFGRFEFPLKKFWFACVIAIIIIPPQIISSSLYTTFARFDLFGLITLLTGSTINLRASIWPYIMMSLTCMGLKNGLYIFMLRQYFKNVPDSLEEAAYVDGCGTFHTFVRIMLPDAAPTIASCFLFSFVWQWTDLFYSRNFLSGFSLYSVQLSTIGSRMARYFAADPNNPPTVDNGRSLQLISIGVLICCIPLIILYCFTQRTFVESLAMTGSKE